MPDPISNQSPKNEPHRLEQGYVLSAKRAVWLFVLFLLFQIAIELVLSFALGIYGGIQVSQGYMNSTEMQIFLTNFHFPVAIYIHYT